MDVFEFTRCLQRQNKILLRKTQNLRSGIHLNFYLFIAEVAFAKFTWRTAFVRFKK